MKIASYSYFWFLLLSCWTASATATSCLTVETVPDLNLTQYVSRPWYVQKQAPNSYTLEDYNRCVTAQYVEKGYSTFWGYTIGIYNYAENALGESMGGDLCAKPTPQSSSQLWVAPCFLPVALSGPYWIVDYEEDEINGYALISGGQPRKIVQTNGCGPDSNSPCCKTGDDINNSGLW